MSVDLGKARTGIAVSDKKRELCFSENGYK